MKKIMLFLSLYCFAIEGFSQVGINTTSPDAQLQIKSSNQATPANTDGILIPKIDAFPVTNPTAAQQGMMVYLTTISAGKAPGFYYWDNTGTPQWKVVGGDSGWELLGNAGTDPAVNFIGTTDATDVVFRRDNVISGKIGMANTSFGRSAMNPLNSGIYNSAFGLSSMLSNTTGSSNAAFGNYTLFSNTTGSSNTGVGSNTLYTNTIGQHNTALGSNSLEYNTQGNDNSAIGYYSLYKNTLGNNNTANGNEALYENLTGNNNTAIGYQSGNTITSGSNNLTLGVNSNVPLPTGSNQLSIGNVIYGAAMNASSFARIGINEPSPNAKLQINASSQANPNNSDGIIIPKVDTFPIINPGSLQNGMLVFLTTPANKSGFYYWDNPSTSWKGIGANSGWGLTGNAGTAAATNFIGTTDDVDVVFKRNTLKSGLISTSNTAFGQNAFSVNTTGTNNTANGVDALAANTTGVSNTANGFASLFANTLGNFNTATGYNALAANTTGGNNTANGVYALYKSKFGQNNTANGASSLYENISGSNNTANGTSTLYSNTSGNYNTAVGVSALYYNTTGFDNTAIGVLALQSNKAGSKATAIGKSAMQFANDTTTTFDNENVAIGYEALKGSPTPANNTGNSNTAIGYQTLLSNSTGYFNTANGHSALYSNESGDFNTAIGAGALYNNISGERNSVNGIFALYSNLTGSSNTVCGEQALVTNKAGSKATAIGSYAMENANSTTVPFDNQNVAVGYEALRGSSASATNTGNKNTAVGYQTLLNNTSGDSNIAIGANVLYLNTTGFNNTANGVNALYSNTTGNYNTATGHNSMYKLNGQENTANGVNAMTNATTGNYNTVVGTNSLYTNTGSNTNTTLGHSTLFSNVSGSGNVAIGYQAGYNELGSNKLYIENSNSATPLIYGEFDNNLLRINGRLNGIYTQLTANGDSQSSIFGYRNRDSQNDGTNYSLAGTNRAVSGHNLWGDLYTFGVTGHSDNDFTRTGGVLGSITGGTYWSSLGYKNSAGTAYGVYATAVLATGAGRFSQPQKNFSIGGGFYGGMIGSWSKGNIIGQISSGTMFASYNSGDEYTTGKQIELVDTGSQKTAAYTVTSTESIVYKKGKTTLINGTARVDFDKNYLALLGEIPVVTITPMGQCNGLFIESIDQNGFTIKELNNGTSNVAISWIAVGDRIDAQQNKLPKALLEKDFDNNINEVMFNENNKTETAKAMWFDGTNIQFGQLPSEFIEKNTAKKE